MAHTPGQWRISDPVLNGFPYSIVSPIFEKRTTGEHFIGNTLVAVIADPERTDAIDNALLIVAAPVLLEALRIALLHIERMNYETTRNGNLIEIEKWGTTATPTPLSEIAFIKHAIELVEGK